jgi:GNAT superfamily N-acetyltransferase
MSSTFLMAGILPPPVKRGHRPSDATVWQAGRMTEIIFRDARRDEVPAIVALLSADSYAGQRRPTSTEDYLRAFDAIAADPNNRLVVADRDGEVVGTLQLTLIPSLSRRGALRAQIEGVRVRGDLRGGGLGRRMVTYAVDEARERGCGLVQLTTDKRRLDAQRFYVSLGFEATHEGMKLLL